MSHLQAPMGESRSSSVRGLRRITLSLAYRPEIDGIRFIAISCVIMYHITGDILRHSSADYAAVSTSLLLSPMLQLKFGVQLFFVLSGFVLGLPFARHFLSHGSPVSLKAYFRRRLTRLEPPYMLALLLLTMAKILGRHYGAVALLPHLAASMAYLHNLIYHSPSIVDFVAWSLEVEVQFYLLAPFLAALTFSVCRSGPRRLGLTGAIVSCSVLATLFPNALLTDLSVLGYLQYFLAGFLLADLDVSQTGTTTSHLPWDLFAIAALSLLGALICRGGSTLILAGPLIICATYYAAFRSTSIKRLLSAPILSIIGGMCYSIYLLHNYVIAFIGSYSERLTASLTFPERLGVQMLIMAGPILLICGVFFFFIERPCMRPDWPARIKERFSAFYAYRGRIAVMRDASYRHTPSQL